METGEGELHLGLDPGDLQDAAPVRARGQVLQKGGLADPRLAAEDERLTSAATHCVDNSIQSGALVSSTA
jgi:hypothetical protein